MRRQFQASTALAAVLLSLGGAHQTARAAEAATAATPDATHAVSEVVVTSDRAGLLERRAGHTALGLDKPLIDTPRAASLVTATTIERYGVRTVNDLTAVAPGTFTASFYGVAGSLNVRGTYAENYFQGFKLIENLGTYATPVGDAARIDIVRGPPSPVYGPGRVGGLLNFIPKTSSDDASDRAGGDIAATFGSYQKKNITAQGDLPITLGDVRGGLHVYGEWDDSHSFYRGIYPKHQMGEASLRLKFPRDWTLSIDAMLYHATGDVQTPGWNRLTQSLIDTGTYTTGRNTALSAGPSPYLAPGQVMIPPGFYPYLYSASGNAGLTQAWFGFQPAQDPRFSLDTGVGTTKLSPRDVYLSPYDFSRTTAPTVRLALEKGDLPLEGKAALELFYTGLGNQRYVSYGFPAWLRANVLEARLSYSAKASAADGLIHVSTVVGLGDRNSQARDMQSYNSGVIALDRRDIAHGATPTDTLCSPFAGKITGDQIPADCLGWENDIHSRINDFGVFALADAMIGSKLNLVVGGRWDQYNVRSSDSGILPYASPGPVSASKGLGTYSVSLSYHAPLGLMPYVTYAQNSALEYGQAGDLSTSVIQNGGWLRTSILQEAGLKGQWLNGALTAALSVYRQTRPVLTGAPPSVVNTVGKGEELEIRWVADRHLSFTFAGNLQHTEVIGPDNSFQYIPAYLVCGQTMACATASFGGAYVVYSFAGVPGRSGNYAYSPIPHSVDSLYATYTTDNHAWGRAGLTLGSTYVSKTSGTAPGAVVYPSYFLENLSIFLRRGRTEIDLNIDNLLNQRYFTPDADTYVNLGALPGVGREWRITLKRSF